MTSDFRDTLYTIDTKGRRKWVYPTLMSGAFRSRRSIVISALIGFYIAMPWLVIEGEQAVRLDLMNRKFTFFGAEFLATDTFYLFLLLGTLAFSLFFFTALLGRVWCGWACPQTVFLEFVFRPIERLIEGDGAARLRLDQAPWEIKKILKKGAKYLIFAAVSWILSSTALAYFVGRDELLTMMAHSPLTNLPLFMLMLALMGVLLFQFGWFREQFCSVVCPYARFQSVMLDPDSLVISYDTGRGEPRGKGNDVGDCVDCGLCVRVCPTGIDIRNGLQLECVQCASCIDACDSIMTKLERPKGLIRYTTERVLKEKKLRILRPRVLLYGAIIGIYLCTFGFRITHRKELEFQFIRVATHMPFTIDASGTVTNQFRIHVANRSESAAAFTLRVIEPETAQAVVPVSPFPIDAEEERDLPLFLRFPKAILRDGKALVKVHIQNGDKIVGKDDVPVIGPDV